MQKSKPMSLVKWGIMNAWEGVLEFNITKLAKEHGLNKNDVVKAPDHAVTLMFIH